MIATYRGTAVEDRNDLQKLRIAVLVYSSFFGYPFWIRPHQVAGSGRLQELHPLRV